MDFSKFFVVIGAKTDGMTKGLNDAKGKLNSFNKGVSDAGKKMTMGVTAPIIGATAVSFKMAADFDNNFRKVNVMLQSTDKETAKYKQGILDIAKATGQSANDVVNSYYQIVSAGYRGSESLDILETAMRGATGGSADAVQTTAALTKAMNIFQLEGAEGSTKAMDSFFGIVDSGLLTFEQLANSFPTAASMAAGLGTSIEETGAALATLTKTSGSTEDAATTLNAIFEGLITPTKGMEALFAEWGVKSGPEAIEKFGGLAGVLNKVKDATGGEVVAMSNLFGSSEAMKGLMPMITSSYDDYNEALETGRNSTGMMDEAFTEMSEGVTFQMSQLTSIIQGLAITLGEVFIPAISKIVEAIAPVLKKIAGWIEENPKLTATIFGILAVAGPLLMFLGSVMSIIPAIAGALPFLGAAFAALSGPVGIAIAIIAAVIAIGVLVVKNWDWVKEKAAVIWESVKDIVGSIADGIKWYFENMTPIGFIISNWEKISSAATSIFGKVVDFFKSIPGKIKSAFSSLADIMLAPFRLYVRGFESAINWIIDQLNKVSGLVPDWFPGGGGLSIPEISLPFFAEGGIVTRPTLAMVGEAGPEAIVPLNQAGTVGTTVNINGNWSIREEADINRIARELGDVVDRKMRLQGA